MCSQPFHPIRFLRKANKTSEKRHFKLANRLALDIRDNTLRPLEAYEAHRRSFLCPMFGVIAYRLFDYEGITVYNESDMLAEDST